jgi:anti-sigma factor RsiW
MKLGISCAEMVPRLDDYVDRALSETESELVERHLGECVSCADRFRFEVSLIKALRRRLRRVPLPASLLPSIRRRLESGRVA